VLSQALQKQKDAEVRHALAEELAVVADSLEPAEATRVCAAAVKTLPGSQVPASLIQRLDPEQAALISRKQAASLCSQSSACLSAPNLDAWLTRASRTEVRRRPTAVATGLGLAGMGPLATLLPLSAAGKPFPCRLATQDLVDLLKMPTCFGEARQVVLKHLGNRYGRGFANHWEFVRFAREQHLDLDFTTPPRRPSRP
jgi:hypothetical protein